MNTKFNSNDKVWIMATIRRAEQVGGKVYYTIDESDYLVPEDICRKCTDDDISVLKEVINKFQYADWKEIEKGVSYSSRQNLVLPA